MSAICRRTIPQIAQVLVYKGHQAHPLLGPYGDNIAKRIAMFDHLNTYREARKQRSWKVLAVTGEELSEKLNHVDPQETLLVIPAGQSTHLDAVFTHSELNNLMGFFKEGGRGYLTCGSAYWASCQRFYNGLCETNPEQRQLIVKTSNLPLFQGAAYGPLCPYPGNKYKVGFYSDAVRVASGKDECTIYLSGGGSFVPDPDQPVKVLVRYPVSELERHGKPPEEHSLWENATILVPVGKGAALLSMFHPYYGPNDIDVERYNEAFPDSGTNWKEVHRKLSSHDVRMRFVLDNMITPLENMELK